MYKDVYVKTTFIFSFWKYPMSLICCISGFEHKPGKFLFWRRAATTRPTVPVGRKFCILLSRKGAAQNGNKCSASCVVACRPLIWVFPKVMVPFISSKS